MVPRASAVHEDRGGAPSGAIRNGRYIRGMFTTSQFRVFATEPGERTLARARHLLRDASLDEAEEAYLEIIDRQPDLPLAWCEYFELLRGQRRFEEALALSAQAADQFGDAALPLALKGAALVELGRYREGLVALEQAAARNPDFAMVWHEAGYAAYRLGEHDRALLALDRAFALEPHSGTLHLRGKILRGAGRYLAAEVAFQGAAEAAEFPEQRAEAERQVAITRRYAAFSGRRPTELIASQRWFGDHGASLLTRADGEHHPSPERLVQEFITVAREEGWRFTHLVTTDEWDGWVALAAALSLPGHDGRALPPDAVPLVVGLRPGGAGSAWAQAARAVARSEEGLTFAVFQPLSGQVADVAGILEGSGRVRVDLSAAEEAIRHPQGRLRGRRLRARTG
jgi:tetratricopeptide (TPR) repeat protein